MELRWVVLLLVLAIAGAVLCVVDHHTIVQGLLHLAVLGGELGVVGIALYAGLFVLGTMAFVPTTSLEMVAGLVFSRHYSMAGAMLIAGGSKLASGSLHFVLGRSLLRDFVEKKVLARFVIFKVAARLITTDAIKTISAIRFAPIPNIAKNLGLAALGAPYQSFALVTTLFGVPWTVAAVFAGASLTSLPEILDGSGREKLAELLRPYTENRALTGGVLFAGTALIAYASLGAKRAYNDMINEAAKSD